MKKSRQISLKECYNILQLESDATLEDVKKSYRKLAFELHPDLNPTLSDASSKFKRLNEAYVSLSQVLQTEEGARKASAKKEEAKQKEQDKKQKAEDKKQKEQEKEQSKKQEEKAQANKKTEEKKQSSKQEESKKEEEKKQETKTKAEANRQRAASAAYAKEDVLRDLLHDPFARRVFEDIYSEVSKQAEPKSSTNAKPTPPPPPPPQAPPTVEVDLGHSNNLSHFANNFSGKIMGWFRQQIDEEQSIKLPASALFAGAKVRLQIRQGLSDEVNTIEIVLPKDFVAGKPIRLRGLGKKVGKWQGDLYLTIECKQENEK